MKGVVNHIRGVDLLVSLTEVDSKRIGVIGHSLGGHNSLYLAAFDPRIRAVVTSCGFTAKDRYLGGDLRGWSSDRYMPLVALNYHGRASELPWDFDDVLVAIAPRRIFVNAPVHDDNFDARGVDECVARARARVPSEFIVMKHPDCAHDFPQEIRMQAYEFLDRELTPEGVSQSPIRRTPGEVTSRRARS
jgi:dienelactone hydrolase